MTIYDIDPESGDFRDKPPALSDEETTQAREKATAYRYAVLERKAAYRASGVPERHNKVITPYTDPESFTAIEKKIFDSGECGWLVEYGTSSNQRYCHQDSNPGASFGHCGYHEDELLESYYPDGSPR